MAIEDLFDHRAEVWRPVETRGVAGDVQTTMTRVQEADSTNCAVVPPRIRVEDIGPGETTRGRIEMYLGRTVEVAERDVVRLVSGPQSPRSYRAVSVAHVRGHHIEVVIEPWTGTFPGEN